MTGVELRGPARLIHLYASAVGEPSRAVKRLLREVEIRVVHHHRTHAGIAFGAALPLKGLGVDLYLVSGVVMVDLERPLPKRDLPLLQSIVQPIAEDAVRYLANAAHVDVAPDWPPFVRFIKTLPRPVPEELDDESPD